MLSDGIDSNKAANAVIGSIIVVGKIMRRFEINEITENVTNAMITSGSVPAVTAKEDETEEKILCNKTLPCLTLLVLSKKNLYIGFDSRIKDKVEVTDNKNPKSAAAYGLMIHNRNTAIPNEFNESGLR